MDDNTTAAIVSLGILLILGLPDIIRAWRGRP